MGAYSTEHELNYGDAPPVLITGGAENGLARAEAVIQAFGLRIAGPVSLTDAPRRLELQGRASAVWMELEREPGAELDHLVSRLNADVSDGRYGAVVSAPMELVDRLWSELDSEIQLIVDPDDGDRASALAIALARRKAGALIADVASDRNADRLRQLSDEVSRIASTLARLSAAPAAAPATLEQRSREDAPAVSLETVRAVIRARRLRARYFQEDLFADPAWDMLLDLLQAEIAQLRVPVSSLCIAAAVPATTALRCLKALVSRQIFIRRADPHDGRRVFVELAPETSRALRSYFSEVGHVPVV